MAVPLKYAVIERERRFLVRSVPSGVTGISKLRDRYIDASRLRLREVRGHDGRLVRKLGQKIRLGDGPSAIACTSMYLDDEEWSLLSSLPARVVTKRRHHLERDGVKVVIDEFEDGTLLAEIDDGDRPPAPVPSWLDVVEEVTGDDAWTGGDVAVRVQQSSAS
jgi:CYTH domain-containing protein